MSKYQPEVLSAAFDPDSGKVRLAIVTRGVKNQPVDFDYFNRERAFDLLKSLTHALATEARHRKSEQAAE